MVVEVTASNLQIQNFLYKNGFNPDFDPESKSKMLSLVQHPVIQARNQSNLFPLLLNNY